MKFSVYIYRQNNLVVPQFIVEEISSAIQISEVNIRKGSSSKIKQKILAELTKKGWSGEVILDVFSKISITSMKSNIGLVFQTGKW